MPSRKIEERKQIKLLLQTTEVEQSWRSYVEGEVFHAHKIRSSQLTSKHRVSVQGFACIGTRQACSVVIVAILGYMVLVVTQRHFQDDVRQSGNHIKLNILQ